LRLALCFAENTQGKGLLITQTFRSSVSTTRANGGRGSRFQGRHRITVYIFELFKRWYFDNHFKLATLKATFVNVLILATTILR